MRRILDAILELRILYATRIFVGCPSKANYYLLADLCGRRSQQQIKRMEERKGLV